MQHHLARGLELRVGESPPCSLARHLLHRQPVQRRIRRDTIATTANDRSLQAALGQQRAPSRVLIVAHVAGSFSALAICRLPALERPRRKPDPERRTRRRVGVLIGSDVDAALRAPRR